MAEDKKHEEYLDKALAYALKGMCDFPNCYEDATANHEVAGITLYLCSKHDVGHIDSKILIEIKRKKERMKSHA